jgi:hypothetical protein
MYLILQESEDNMLFKFITTGIMPDVLFYMYCFIYHQITEIDTTNLFIVYSIHSIDTIKTY